MDKVFKIILLTLMPSIELRGSIPYLFSLKLNLNQLFFLLFLIFLVNLSVGIGVYFLADYLITLGYKIPYFRNFWDNYIKRASKRGKKSIDKWRNAKIIGLALFIGIPLPGTGAYTGAIVAHILSINPKEFLFSLFFGLIMATILVSLVSFSIFSFI